MKSILVIPCYNEANRLKKNEFEHFLSNNPNIHLRFINDGSIDKTKSVLNDIAAVHSNATVLNLEYNLGKAGAIRKGVLSINSSEYEIIGYLDADLATPLEEMRRLIQYYVELPNPLWVMGSRVKLLGFSEIKRKISRHYIGRIFATIVSNMLRLSVYDTQCGAKLIKSEIASELFKQPFVSKWLFDVELLFRLKNLNENNIRFIYEVPLKTWKDINGSKINLFYYIRAPFDLARIYIKYN